MLIDGKKIASKICQDVQNKVHQLQQNGVIAKLVVILVGEDSASHIYVANKVKKCKQVGIESQVIRLPATISEAKLLSTVEQCNADASIHGILVQLPLPKHIDKLKIINAIDSSKDVDGFSFYNTGALVNQSQVVAPCTPMGIIKLLQSTAVPLVGKHAVIIGRSSIVGRPMAQLLLAQDCTVTICHSKTVNLQAITRQADILIAAIGSAQFVKKDWVKPNAIVIDVGINRIQDGQGYRIVGDVDYDNVKTVASFITPVPGGCGPMTIACLLENTVQLASK